MATHRAPKQWTLTKKEDLSSFESWKNNIVYVLSLDSNFAPYLLSSCSWQKKSKASPTRGFTDDANDAANKKTAAQKVAELEMCLGMIANYAPVVSRHQIITNSTSLDQIWQILRAHYGIQTSGAQFLDLADFVLEHEERPEDLFQRLMAFVEDSLLTSACNIVHHGSKVAEDEELTPTLENIIVLTWLRLIHKDLPKLVKQKYGTVLRSCTLASIKPEISIALDSLLDEINSSSEHKLMRIAPKSSNNFNKFSNFEKSFEKSSFHQNRRPGPQKSCPICKAAHRNDQHFLSSCRFLPPADRKFLTKARLVNAIDDLCLSDGDDDAQNDNQLGDDNNVNEDPSSHIGRISSALCVSRRVQTCRSPWFSAYAKENALTVTVDSGAEVSMIKHAVAVKLQCKILRSSQRAIQADGSTPINVVGEVNTVIYHQNVPLRLQALVCVNIDDQVIAGIPFLKENGIKLDFVDDKIIFSDGSSVSWSSSERRLKSTSYLMRVKARTTVWPGDSIELDIPDCIPADSTLSVESRPDLFSSTWPSPQEVLSIDHKIRITNTTELPITIPAKAHVCQLLETVVPECHDIGILVPKMSKSIQPFSSGIILSDCVLNSPSHAVFQSIHDQFDNVFNPNYPGYNSAYGNVKGSVNIGPILPPQRKGRLPQYDRSKLVELQAKCDELELLGVLRKPDDLNVKVEYLNPSFLVKKSSGGHRLVTAFSEVGKYARPQPSLMPDVDNTLRIIAKWKYLIKTDLTSAFYQIPLEKASLRFCGIVTPFKGVRVYTRCAMGLPGSETALEELMSRVLGELLQQGCIAKVADDLYVGGDSMSDLAENWKAVLCALSKADLRLAAHKTEIAPQQTTILGWLWSNGSISALPHRISSLSTCSKPSTVKDMRSFIGAYKFLSRVLPDTAAILAPLDIAVAGSKSSDHIKWNSDLDRSFDIAQKHLASHKTVHTPTPNDKLWIMSDGAVKSPGIGATMYAQAPNEKPRLAGFFSMKLKFNQIRWTPCEAEALAIATAIKHFAPYIIQTSNTTTVLSDSKPCIQAAQKLARGEFSASSRVATFMSVASRYHVSFMHLKGALNLSADFQSRNTPSCELPSCQICSFVRELSESVVRSVSVNDIISGKVSSPFASRNAWKSIQEECLDVCNAKNLLKRGSRLSKNVTKMTDVKRYANIATIAKDDLLVVRRSEPFTATRECIVVPRGVAHGLVTAIHIRLSHPSAHQLKRVIARSFYIIGLDNVVEDVVSHCSTCAALKSFPNHLVEQSTGDPPAAIGISFAADVLRRNRQFILVVRENISCYTSATVIANEQRDTLRDALIQLIVPLSPSLTGLRSVVRTDPAPGFQALVNDVVLGSHNMSVEIGCHKNINKNPRAERAIHEIVEELNRSNVAYVSSVRLAILMAAINSKVRGSGLSANEMWTHRDQHTGEQLPFDELILITNRQIDRKQSHLSSAMSKSSVPARSIPNIGLGDLVYLISDKNKLSTRPKYIVSTIEGSWCNIRKFTGFQLRGLSYRVKLSDVFKAAPSHEPRHEPKRIFDDDDDACINHPLPQPSESAIDTHDTSHGVLEDSVPHYLSPPSDEIESHPELSFQSPIEVSTPDTTSRTVPTSLSDYCPIVPRRSTRARNKPDYFVP